MTPADNHLLRRLPSGELSRLINGGSGGLEKVYPERDEVLCHVGKVFEHVFFPVTNVVSLLAILDDKRSVAFSPIGREGVVGTIGLNRQQGSPMRCVQTISGDCYSIPATTIGDLLPECPVLAESLALAGNRVRVEGADRRVPQASFGATTHLPLALGAGRPLWQRAVYDHAILAWRNAGRQPHQHQPHRRSALNAGASSIISTAIWEILKRPRLENLSCECYRISQEIYRSVMHRKP